MVYMSVLVHSDTHLKLLKEPSALSKIVFSGFLVGITGIVLFGSESWLAKAVLGVVTIGLSCFIMDNYEICEFNKEQREVYLTRLHWSQYLLGQVITLGPQPHVIVKLKDIKDARIEEQMGDTGKKAFQVALFLYSGVHLGLTEVFTTDPVEEHEAVVKKIMDFLDIKTSPVSLDVDDDEAKELTEEEKSSEDDLDDDDEEDEDDDFEQISKADVEDFVEDEAVCTETLAKV